MYNNIEDRLGGKIEEIKSLKSGWAGEIISFKLNNNPQRYIIKTYNSSKSGIKNIKQEWEALNMLYRVNYPVPKPIFSNFIEGKPFIVMEEIKGESLWDCYQNNNAKCREKLLSDFVIIFFKLHHLDISIVKNKTIKNNTEYFIDQEINEIEELVKENNLGYFTDIIDWLKAEKLKVINCELAIIHRDYHPWNVIVNKNKQLYVIDLLCGIGDYRFDLAWMCTLMERSGFEEFSNEVFNKYRELKGEDIKNFEYFKVFSTLRWLINVISSLKTGDNLNETRNEEFKEFILPLIKKAFKLIEEITCIKKSITFISKESNEGDGIFV